MLRGSTALGLASLALIATAARASDLVVHAGTLIDGTGKAPSHQVSILIHDDRIVAIQPGFQSPAGAAVIDLSHETVMPGFIDVHVHIAAKLPSRTNATEDWLTHSALDRAFDGAMFARQMLLQGFTSGRDCGGGDDTVAVRGAINTGKIDGPRLWVALEALGPTAGHGDPHSGLDHDLSHPGWENGIVDTPEQARIRVREHKARGADLIKIMPSGGIASTGDDPRQQLMTNEEIQVAVTTAHSLGMKVAAHIYPAAAIENAVRAGVDSVEHGSFATAETFELMKAHGTYLVPTLTVFQVFYEAARDHPELLTPGTAAKELANDLLPKQNLPLAIRSGVKIAYGTDIGEGDHTMEFGLLAAGGMKPMDAILAATRNAADLLGASDRVGSVQPERYADLVAVNGDPLGNPELLRRVTFVMKGGITYLRDGKPAIH
ncbi:amidohydrolase family protein [Novosphingobium sp.]|uniref:metal-dependent hydrolase family protein n=1 Tax=Novosphingobium sp. TaxID=1874826 RepID=UPI003341FAA7